MVKGVVLAGGLGKRLGLVTRVTNKHLLPVGSLPMVFYPLNTLKSMGVTDIMIVTGTECAGDFLRLLGSGSEFGFKFTYRVQDGAGGIAQALSLAENFVGKEKFVVVLGDNIFEDDFSSDLQAFVDGPEEARVFLKEVPDPERFGVAELDGSRVVGIEEKPKEPKSSYCVTGLYMYSPKVFDIIRTLKPSARGEYEITDAHNVFIRRGSLAFSFIKGGWTDAGTPDSLFRAAMMVKEKGC